MDFFVISSDALTKGLMPDIARFLGLSLTMAGNRDGKSAGPMDVVSQQTAFMRALGEFRPPGPDVARTLRSLRNRGKFPDWQSFATSAYSEFDLLLREMGLGRSSRPPSGGGGGNSGGGGGNGGGGGPRGRSGVAGGSGRGDGGGGSSKQDGAGGSGGGGGGGVSTSVKGQGYGGKRALSDQQGDGGGKRQAGMSGEGRQRERVFPSVPKGGYRTTFVDDATFASRQAGDVATGREKRCSRCNSDKHLWGKDCPEHPTNQHSKGAQGN